MGSCRPRMPAPTKMPQAVKRAGQILEGRLTDSTLIARGWEDFAACKRKQAEWFAPDEQKITHTYYEPAYRICRNCLVAGECLAAAILEEKCQSQANVFGIRGGLIPRERIALSILFGVRDGGGQLRQIA